eukprot:93312_1
MQPLILFRYLSSQLKDDERDNLIQAVIARFGAERILSFIFNHFLLQYNQTKQHHDDLSSVTQMISNILDSRKPSTANPSPNNDDMTNTANPQISMDAMPSAMIGECASYLPLTDYLYFAKCSRKTYIGCNSPSTLRTLPLALPINVKDIKLANLNQFKSLTSLGLDITAFNAYLEFHPQQNAFRRLDSLLLFNEYKNNPDHVDTFLNNNCIPFQNIKTLWCVGFGHSLRYYDFASFCRLLSAFPNVTQLKLEAVFLTEYVQSNGIAELFPNLSTFNFRKCVNESVEELGNQLVSMYSKQMESLRYHESQIEINFSAFAVLKELYIVDIDPANVDSLYRLVSNTSTLERLHFSITPGLQHTLDDINMKNTMIAFFTKCNNMEAVEVNCDYAMCQQIIKYIEIALFMVNTRQTLTIVLCLLAPNNEHGNNETNVEIDREQVYLWLSRLINALDASKIEHFALGFHIEFESETLHFDSNMERFKENHLVHVDNNLRSVIVSNKNCKINGYRTRWINHTFLDHITL